MAIVKPKYEFKIRILTGNITHIENECNKMGDDGWNLVDVDDGLYCFERKVDQRYKK